MILLGIGSTEAEVKLVLKLAAALPQSHHGWTDEKFIRTQITEHRKH